jgi:hypothetical protein
MFSRHWWISIFDTLFFDVVCILYNGGFEIIIYLPRAAVFKRMLGSVASGVARYAHCPGMIVK